MSFPQNIPEPLSQIFSNLEKEVIQNEEGLDHLLGICNLDKNILSLCQQLVHQSVASSHEFHEDLYQDKSLRVDVQESWAFLGKLLKLVDFHAQTSAEYNQFYNSVKECEAVLTQRWARIHHELGTTHFDGTIEEGKRLKASFKLHMCHIQHLSQRLDGIFETSVNLSPIHRRLQSVVQGEEQAPLQGVILCGYENHRIHLYEGDPVMVLNTNCDQFSGTPTTTETDLDEGHWLVKNARGEIGPVPSAVVFLTSPDVESRGVALALHENFHQLWSRSVRLCYKTVVNYFHTFLQRLSTPSTAPPADTSGSQNPSTLLPLVYVLETSYEEVLPFLATADDPLESDFSSALAALRALATGPEESLHVEAKDYTLLKSIIELLKNFGSFLILWKYERSSPQPGTEGASLVSPPSYGCSEEDLLNTMSMLDNLQEKTRSSLFTLEEIIARFRVDKENFESYMNRLADESQRHREQLSRSSRRNITSTFHVPRSGRRNVATPTSSRPSVLGSGLLPEGRLQASESLESVIVDTGLPTMELTETVSNPLLTRSEEENLSRPFGSTEDATGPPEGISCATVESVHLVDLDGGGSGSVLLTTYPVRKPRTGMLLDRLKKVKQEDSFYCHQDVPSTSSYIPSRASTPSEGVRKVNKITQFETTVVSQNIQGSTFPSDVDLTELVLHERGEYVSSTTSKLIRTGEDHRHGGRVIGVKANICVREKFHHSNQGPIIAPMVDSHSSGDCESRVTVQTQTLSKSTSSSMEYLVTSKSSKRIQKGRPNESRLCDAFVSHQDHTLQTKALIDAEVWAPDRVETKAPLCDATSESPDLPPISKPKSATVDAEAISRERVSKELVTTSGAFTTCHVDSAIDVGEWPKMRKKATLIDTSELVTGDLFKLQGQQKLCASSSNVTFTEDWSVLLRRGATVTGIRRSHDLAVDSSHFSEGSLRPLRDSLYQSLESAGLKDDQSEFTKLSEKNDQQLQVVLPLTDSESSCGLLKVSVVSTGAHPIATSHCSKGVMFTSQIAEEPLLEQVHYMRQQKERPPAVSVISEGIMFTTFTEDKLVEHREHKATTNKATEMGKPGHSTTCYSSWKPTQRHVSSEISSEVTHWSTRATQQKVETTDASEKHSTWPTLAVNHSSCMNPTAVDLAAHVDGTSSLSIFVQNFHEPTASSATSPQLLSLSENFSIFAEETNIHEVVTQVSNSNVKEATCQFFMDSRHSSTQQTVCWKDSSMEFSTPRCIERFDFYVLSCKTREEQCEPIVRRELSVQVYLPSVVAVSAPSFSIQTQHQATETDPLVEIEEPVLKRVTVTERPPLLPDYLECGVQVWLQSLVVNRAAQGEGHKVPVKQESSQTMTIPCTVTEREGHYTFKERQISSQIDATAVQNVAVQSGVTMTALWHEYSQTQNQHEATQSDLKSHPTSKHQCGSTAAVSMDSCMEFHGEVREHGAQWHSVGDHVEGLFTWELEEEKRTWETQTKHSTHTEVGISPRPPLMTDMSSEWSGSSLVETFNHQEMRLQERSLQIPVVDSLLPSCWSEFVCTTHDDDQQWLYLTTSQFSCEYDPPTTETLTASSPSEVADFGMQYLSTPVEVAHVYCLAASSQTSARGTLEGGFVSDSFHISEESVCSFLAPEPLDTASSGTPVLQSLHHNNSHFSQDVRSMDTSFSTTTTPAMSSHYEPQVVNHSIGVIFTTCEMVESALHWSITNVDKDCLSSHQTFSDMHSSWNPTSWGDFASFYEVPKQDLSVHATQMKLQFNNSSYEEPSMKNVLSESGPVLLSEGHNSLVSATAEIQIQQSPQRLNNVGWSSDSLEVASISTGLEARPISVTKDSGLSTSARTQEANVSFQSPTLSWNSSFLVAQPISTPTQTQHLQWTETYSVHSPNSTSIGTEQLVTQCEQGTATSHEVRQRDPSVQMAAMELGFNNSSYEVPRMSNVYSTSGMVNFSNEHNASVLETTEVQVQQCPPIPSHMGYSSESLEVVSVSTGLQSRTQPVVKDCGLSVSGKTQEAYVSFKSPTISLDSSFLVASATSAPTQTRHVQWAETFSTHSPSSTSIGTELLVAHCDQETGISHEVPHRDLSVQADATKFSSNNSSYEEPKMKNVSSESGSFLLSEEHNSLVLATAEVQIQQSPRSLSNVGWSSDSLEVVSVSTGLQSRPPTMTKDNGLSASARSHDVNVSFKPLTIFWETCFQGTQPTSTPTQTKAFQWSETCSAHFPTSASVGTGYSVARCEQETTSSHELRHQDLYVQVAAAEMRSNNSSYEATIMKNFCSESNPVLLSDEHSGLTLATKDVQIQRSPPSPDHMGYSSESLEVVSISTGFQSRTPTVTKDNGLSAGVKTQDADVVFKSPITSSTSLSILAIPTPIPTQTQHVHWAHSMSTHSPSSASVGTELLVVRCEQETSHEVHHRDLCVQSAAAELKNISLEISSVLFSDEYNSMVVKTKEVQIQQSPPSPHHMGYSSESLEVASVSTGLQSRPTFVMKDSGLSTNTRTQEANVSFQSPTISWDSSFLIAQPTSTTTQTQYVQWTETYSTHSPNSASIGTEQSVVHCDQETITSTTSRVRESTSHSSVNVQDEHSMTQSYKLEHGNYSFETSFCEENVSVQPQGSSVELQTETVTKFNQSVTQAPLTSAQNLFFLLNVSHELVQTPTPSLKATNSTYHSTPSEDKSTVVTTAQIQNHSSSYATTSRTTDCQFQQKRPEAHISSQTEIVAREVRTTQCQPQRMVDFGESLVLRSGSIAVQPSPPRMSVSSSHAESVSSNRSSQTQQTKCTDCSLIQAEPGMIHMSSGSEVNTAQLGLQSYEFPEMLEHEEQCTVFTTEDWGCNPVSCTLKAFNVSYSTPMDSGECAYLEDPISMGIQSEPPVQRHYQTNTSPIQMQEKLLTLPWTTPPSNITVQTSEKVMKHLGSKYEVPPLIMKSTQSSPPSHDSKLVETSLTRIVHRELQEETRCRAQFTSTSPSVVSSNLVNSTLAFRDFTHHHLPGTRHVMVETDPLPVEIEEPFIKKEMLQRKEPPLPSNKCVPHASYSDSSSSMDLLHYCLQTMEMEDVIEILTSFNVTSEYMHSKSRLVNTKTSYFPPREVPQTSVSVQSEEEERKREVLERTILPTLLHHSVELQSEQLDYSALLDESTTWITEETSQFLQEHFEDFFRMSWRDGGSILYEVGVQTELEDTTLVLEQVEVEEEEEFICGGEELVRLKKTYHVNPNDSETSAEWVGEAGVQTDRLDYEYLRQELRIWEETWQHREEVQEMSTTEVHQQLRRQEEATNWEDDEVFERNSIFTMSELGSRFVEDRFLAEEMTLRLRLQECILKSDLGRSTSQLSTPRSSMLASDVGSSSHHHLSIQGVWSPQRKAYVSLQVAQLEGLVDRECQVYVNPHSGIRIPMSCALRMKKVRLSETGSTKSGSVLSGLDADPPVYGLLTVVKEMLQSILKVNNVLCAESGEIYTLNEAVNARMVDLEAGQYRSLSREPQPPVSFMEAVRIGLITVDWLHRSEDETRYHLLLTRILDRQSDPPRWLPYYEATHSLAGSHVYLDALHFHDPTIPGSRIPILDAIQQGLVEIQELRDLKTVSILPETLAESTSTQEALRPAPKDSGSFQS